jgi:hypothetical protein
MSTEYRSSYGPRPLPPLTEPWIVQVATELERIVTSVHDHGIVIEGAVVDEADDSIAVTIFDMRRRSHRRYTIKQVTAKLTRGFDPALTPLSAANLLVLEVATTPGTSLEPPQPN